MKDTDPAGRQRVTRHYLSRPSWKRYGEGNASVELTLNHKGNLSLYCREYCKDTNITRETFTDLTPVEVSELREILNSITP